MTDKRSGQPNSAPSPGSSPSDGSTDAAEAWPSEYVRPQLKKFGTLTQLTLSGTATGNFETSLLTKKYKPKPKS